MYEWSFKKKLTKPEYNNTAAKGRYEVNNVNQDDQPTNSNVDKRVQCINEQDSLGDIISLISSGKTDGCSPQSQQLLYQQLRDKCVQRKQHLEQNSQNKTNQQSSQ